MRNYDVDLKDYINKEIKTNTNLWRYSKGANFGIRLQELVGKFYLDKKDDYNINNVVINTNPNCLDADVVIHFNTVEIYRI